MVEYGSKVTKEEKMKKLKTILLTLVLAVSIVGCVQKEESNNAAPQESEESVSDSVVGGEQEKNEDEMSQSEWMETHGNDNSEAGYEKVNEINIDTDEISLKYTGYEIVDGVGENGEPIKEAVIYFDFANKTPFSERIHEAVQISVFQNGIQLTNWLGDIEGNEAVSNSYDFIIDGATLNVGLLFELKDTENPLKIRVEKSYSEMYGEDSELFAQQQELNLQ